MDLPEDEKFRNDMTKTGVFCPNDGHEMEHVTESDRYTCHWCGGIYEIKDGKVETIWFEGFERPSSDKA